MDILISIFNACKDYCMQNPILAAIVAGALLVLIILLIVIGSLKKKIAQTEKELAAQPAQQPTEQPAQQPAEQPANVETNTPAEDEPISLPTEEHKEEAISLPAEEKAAPVPVEETEEPESPAVAEPLATPPTDEPLPVVEIEKPAAVEETPAEEAPAEETPAAVEETPVENKSANALINELNETEQKQDLYEEDETDHHARYAGKWVICKVVSDALEANEELYFFELHASNGEKLLTSEEYNSYNGALRGIQTHKTNILKGNFKISLTKKGDYIFKLLSGKNMLLCMGENYPTRVRCENAIASTKRFAKTAIVDENVQDFIIKAPAEDDTHVPPVAEGYNGKWVIDTINGPDGENLFYFELFANNGEKLLSSEEYTTYIGAVNGIETHKKNIDNNNFRISLTKHGDYIFKLLNGNGQLLCLGEHYKTKRLCQNAVDSVRRFAPNSPTLIDSSLTKPKI